MRYNFFLVLVVLCFTNTQLIAQGQAVSLPGQWTLQDCFAYAKKYNIQLRLLTNNVELGNQDLEQAKAARLPGLSAASTQSLINYSQSPTGISNLQGKSGLVSNYSVNSSLILYQGGFLRNDINSKQIATQQSRLNLEQAANDITIQIAQAFLNILLEKEFVTADQNIVETSKQQLKQAEDRFNAGSISKKDLVQFEAVLASDQYNLVLAQNLVRQYTLELKQILQLPSTYQLEINVPDNFQTIDSIPDLQQVESTAEQNRPEIFNAKLAIEQANLQLKQAYSAQKPSIILGGAVNSGSNQVTGEKYLNQLSNDLYETLALTISVPIFSNRINKTRIEKSRIDIAQSKLSLQNAATQLSQQVEQAYINVVNAQNQRVAAAIQLKANEENFRISQEQLRLGAIDPVNFLVQKNLYLQAVEANIQAKYNSLLNQGIYEFYLGRPITI